MKLQSILGKIKEALTDNEDSRIEETRKIVAMLEEAQRQNAELDRLIKAKKNSDRLAHERTINMIPMDTNFNRSAQR